VPTVIALLLLAFQQTAPPVHTPGLVVLVGTGASIDAATCAELGAADRLVLAAGDPAAVVDPLEAGGKAKFRVDLDAARPFVGDDRETAERIRSARCIVLSGGGYLDWLHLVTPGGTSTRLSDSIRAAHRGGATVVGVGAAAPFLAKWAMIERSAIPEPDRNPRRHRESVAVEGLGLVPELLVDTSARERGDPGRMLRAAFDGHLDRAIFLDGPTVWIDDPGRNAALLAGTGRTVFFDLGAARRQRGAWRAGRISLLGNGDRWSAKEGVDCAEGGASVRLDADPSLDRLRRSVEAAAGKIALSADERTGASGACRIAFDLEWEPSGS